MRTLSLIWAMLLTLGSITLTSYSVPPVSATHDPTDHTLLASFLGWNSSSPPSNPVFTEFRGVEFTILVRFNDGSLAVTHNLAIYERGALAEFPSVPCAPPCLARSFDVEPGFETTTLLFTPSIPSDDNTGLGLYEYYCEYHAGSMHGQIKVSKSPDLDKDGKVTINDIAEMAFRFDTKVGQTLYMATSDLDNDGDIDINDIAFAAFYFDKILVD